MHIFLRIFQTVWWTIWCRKIFQAVLCPTQLFQWKLICTFNQHCLSYKISNRLQFNSFCFCFSKNSSYCINIIFFKMCRTFKRRLSTHRPMHISTMGHNRGQVSDSLSDKCTALIQNSEKESRKFDCQGTVISFSCEKWPVLSRST